jgi:uncharacterized SAM-binding protein YcdF (DUF218 family)
MRPMRFALTGLAALGALLLVVTLTPLVGWYGELLAGPWGEEPGEILIVLGGSTLSPGIIGESTYWRAVYALREYRAGRCRKIVLSGRGAGEDMRDFLLASGVPASALLVEPRSRTTYENALFTRKLIEGQPGKKVLLTSDYHMFRSVRVFRKLGMEVIPRPAPDAIKRSGSLRSRWPSFIDVSLETAKIVYYFARGWI